MKSSFGGGVRERRGRLAADDRRGLVYEIVVLEGTSGEQALARTVRCATVEGAP
jgi:hypothetical protein